MYWIGGRAVCACVGSVERRHPARPCFVHHVLTRLPHRKRKGRGGGGRTCPNPGGYTVLAHKKEKTSVLGRIDGGTLPRGRMVRAAVGGDDGRDTRPCLDAI